MGRTLSVKKILSTLALGIVLALGFLAGNLFTSSAEGPHAEKASTVQSNEVINTFEGVADYIVKYGRLPDNFITKAEAAKLGGTRKRQSRRSSAWKKHRRRYLSKQRKAASRCGRTRMERSRHQLYIGIPGSDRIVYSNDRLVYKTTDHYKTFTRMR